MSGDPLRRWHLTFTDQLFIEGHPLPEGAALTHIETCLKKSDPDKTSLSHILYFKNTEQRKPVTQNSDVSERP